LNLLEKAQKIQEIKLKKFGAFDKLNASIAKFCLINLHGWKDKTENENKNTNAPITIQINGNSLELE
jgi:hypothetical protein